MSPKKYEPVGSGGPEALALVRQALVEDEAAWRMRWSMTACDCCGGDPRRWGRAYSSPRGHVIRQCVACLRTWTVPTWHR